MRLKVTFQHPPIPDRQFDYSCVDDATYDGSPGSLIGHGATEQTAREDFMDRWMERECERDTNQAIQHAKVWDSILDQVLNGRRA